MDLTDIARTVKGFGDAARNVIATGADGIEVKIAHDGLLRSFASPFFNQRTDAYGGTFEKRMRLPIEVLGSIRDAIGPSYPIGIRLCLNEYTPFGYELDYGLRMAEAFEATGLVDYFNCDAGTFSSFWMEIPPAAVEQGFFRPLNRALKQASSLPVVAFGRIKQAELAERMLELGEADLIGMARALIADPGDPAQAPRGAVGRDPRVHRLQRRLHPPGRAGEGHPLHPESGSRPGAALRRAVRPAGAGRPPRGRRRRRSGGAQGRRDRGPARAPGDAPRTRRGPRRAGPPGARQPLHEEVAEVTAYLEATVSRLGVEVWLNADADVDGLLELEPDVVIVATGSQPNLAGARLRSTTDPDAGRIARDRGLHASIPVPGVDGPNVRSTDEILGGAELPGRRVLVIDQHGHWEAAGTAEYLADRGFEVEIVTDRPEPGFGLEATNRAMFLRARRRASA